MTRLIPFAAGLATGALLGARLAHMIWDILRNAQLGEGPIE